MGAFAILLQILAAAVHVAWNLLGKRGRPSAAFFLVAECSIAPVLAALTLALVGMPRLDPTVCALVAASTCAQALYYVALAAAYARADLSWAYPVLRGLPVASIALVAALRGHGVRIGLLAGAGIVLVALGCAAPALLRGRAAAQALMPAVGALLLAAACTTIYTVLDGEAVVALRAHGMGVGATSLALAALLSCGNAAWLGLWCATRRRERDELREVLTRHRGRAWATGAGIWVSYGLVLAAMALARDVSIVAAFRQVSIPLSLLAARCVLGERFGLERVIGAGLIVAGAVLLACA